MAVITLNYLIRQQDHFLNSNMMAQPKKKKSEIPYAEWEMETPIITRTQKRDNFMLLISRWNSLLWMMDEERTRKYIIKLHLELKTPIFIEW